MRVVRAISEVRTALREQSGSVALVPTMGFFHEGHLALMRAARDRCEMVVVSLFVNPTQFAPGEDLEAYPRDEERDLALAREAGVDIVFAPAADEIYPPGFATKVHVGGIAADLEGAQRGPGHFEGVATVVAKLLNIVQPDVAFFGQKDAQQLRVIRRMVRDLDVHVEIAEVATVREPDGLALSSRNVYLTPAEREQALALSGALAAAQERVARGERERAAVLGAARAVLEAAGLEPEYLDLRSADDFEPAARVNGRTVLAVAARVGRARLIDNVVLGGTT